MSAIKIVGAQTYLNQVAGRTGANVNGQPQTTVNVPIPAGVSLFEPLGGLLSGGGHPEATTLVSGQTATFVPPVGSALTRATDSVRGAFGGLTPRLRSTVAAGPAGGTAEIRAGVGKLRSRLRRIFVGGPLPAGLNPGGPIQGSNPTLLQPLPPGFNPGGPMRPVP
jgi:hypothetical protein